MTKRTYQQLLDNGLAALATHAGVILDATFSTRALRQFLCERCADANVRLQVVELEVALEEIESRLKARGDKAAEISDARLEDLAKLNAAYEPPLELAPDLIRISASGTAAETVKIVLSRLGEKSLSRADSLHNQR